VTTDTEHDLVTYVNSNREEFGGDFCSVGGVIFELFFVFFSSRILLTFRRPVNLSPPLRSGNLKRSLAGELFRSQFPDRNVGTTCTIHSIGETRTTSYRKRRI